MESLGLNKKVLFIDETGEISNLVSPCIRNLRDDVKIFSVRSGILGVKTARQEKPHVIIVGSKVASLSCLSLLIIIRSFTNTPVFIVADDDTARSFREFQLKEIKILDINDGAEKIMCEIRRCIDIKG